LKAEPRISASAEDFDWIHSRVKNFEIHRSIKEYESLYDETLSTVAVDEVVIGTVIQMTLREVVINIGYKSEGVVSLNDSVIIQILRLGIKLKYMLKARKIKKVNFCSHIKKPGQLIPGTGLCFS